VNLTELAEAAGTEEWIPPIVKTVASKGQGIDALAAAIEKHRAHLFGTARGEQRRRERARDELLGVLRATLIEEATAVLAGRIDGAVDRVMKRETDPYTVARELVDAYRAK
jgi:LAO/AO transport system kinase